MAVRLKTKNIEFTTYLRNFCIKYNIKIKIYLISYLFFFIQLHMSYIYEYKDAINYDAWFVSETNKFMLDLEINLLLRMLKPVSGDSVIDIGCGTGISLQPFLDVGVQTTGIDPSPYMLDVAREKFKNRVDFHRGVAESLPFEDNSFNYACLFTSLEFTDNPQKALNEAFRVAKDKIFIGVLNRYAIKNLQRWVHGLFQKSIYSKASTFSIAQLKQMIYTALGDVPVSCRTVIQIPGLHSNFANVIESSKYVQLSPFGAFIGIVVIPIPRYKLRPLKLKYKQQLIIDKALGFAINHQIK